MKTSTLLLSTLLTLPLGAHQQSNFSMKDAVDSSTRVAKTAAYAGATVFFAGMAGLFGVINTAEWLEVSGKLKSRFKPLDAYTIAQTQAAFTHSVVGLFALQAAIYSAKKTKETAANKKES